MSEEVIGEVVGPVSASVSIGSAERYTRSGAQYDVALGGIPFVLAISDDRPYARETAEFKKTQVDQSNTVGDQSLTGYWTRGQSSFHRGAGIRFYEVLEGDTVTNRFTDSLDVDPWTPGELNLKPLMPNINTTAAADAVAHDGAILTLSSGGAARLITYAGSSTNQPSSNGGAITSIATDGTNVYATNGDRIERRIPGGAFTLLWTHHVGGRTWSKVFWAKDRIWAVDNTGEWYTLTTVGGTTAGTDILWTSLKTGVTWSLSDGDGGVFIAARNTVFLSLVDTSTTTPTLQTPVAVASVGAQETISTLGAYLGYLIICSDSGVRMGQIQSGGVLLGNIIVDSNFSACSRVSLRKNLIQATGVADGSTYLYEFNVLEQVSDLQAAYAPTRLVAAGSSASSSIVLSDGRTATISSAGVALESSTDVGLDGYVQTAFHRFGTLEPKDFRTLSIRAEGSGGTIAIEKILRDGTALGLVTLGADNFYSNEIRLNLAGPTDFIGLRFTLISDGGAAPTLLGYQLRALPAPTRQRLIQVPLLCLDKEKVGNVHYGHKGWAWERLSDLETLESASTVVSFQDFRTGETITVSIEKIQHQGKTQPKPGAPNYGGFLVVTLREVT